MKLQKYGFRLIEFTIIDQNANFHHYSNDKDFLHIFYYVNDPLMVVNDYILGSISNNEDLELFKKDIRNKYKVKTRKIKYQKIFNYDR